MQTRNDVDAIKGTVSIVDVVQNAGIDLKREGRELVGLSPFKVERTASFFVDPRKQLFKCFSSGLGGDVIKFVQEYNQIDFHEAIQRLKKDAGLHDPAAVEKFSKRYQEQQRKLEVEQKRRKEKNIQIAKDIWNKAKPAKNTSVETYLSSRGIDLDAIQRLYGFKVPATLRFSHLKHPETKNLHPCMVGSVVDQYGKLTAIHRTYLSDDGFGKAEINDAKLTLGSIYGSIAWLYGPSDGSGQFLILGEGYETTLSVMSALAMQGIKAYAASAVSLGNMSGSGKGKGRFNPHNHGKRLPSTIPDMTRQGLVLPKSIKKIVLLKDADGKDPLATECFIKRAITKFSKHKIKVRVASPEVGKDFNDMAGAGNE